MMFRVGCSLPVFLLFDVLLLFCYVECLCECCICVCLGVFVMCGMCVVYVFGGCACVCACGCDVRVCVVMWFPFFGDEGGGVADLFCECVVLFC